MAQEVPARRRIVVDGSNIATEGRTLPSLAQLDEAIRTFLEEYPGFGAADVTVVVDASFGHRIDPSEVATFEQAVEHGEMITPPAGAVGRGDGFILRIAEKSGALVLSNDSFQEFHAERPWLFEPGRLIGGKPVPGVGWVFTPRTPVRGPRSRSSTAKAKRDGRVPDGLLDDGVGGEEVGEPSPARVRRSSKAVKLAKTVDAAKTTDAATPAKKAAKAPKAPKAAKAAKAAETADAATPAKKAAKAPKATKATKTAKTADAADAAKTAKKAAKVPKAMKTTKTTKTTKKAPKAPKAAKAIKTAKASHSDPGHQDHRPGEPLNDPLTFLTFVTEHPLGSTFDGVVSAFTSHGAHIEVAGMLCHVPLRGLGDPPPQRARQVLSKGESRSFTLVSLDPVRRRAELALAGTGD